MMRTYIASAQEYNDRLRHLLEVLTSVRLFIRRPLDELSPVRTALQQLSDDAVPEALLKMAVIPQLSVFLNMLRAEHVRLSEALDKTEVWLLHCDAHAHMSQSASLHAFRSVEQAMMAFWVDVCQQRNVSPLAVLVVPRVYVGKTIPREYLKLPPGDAIGDLSLTGVHVTGCFSVQVCSTIAAMPPVTAVRAISCSWPRCRAGG